MKPSYPNLELIEYKAFIAFKSNEELAKRFEEAKARYGRIAELDFIAEVFTQMWGSSCTAFDICEDGSPAIGGSAMTEEYTVVMYEGLTNTYFVFVNNRLCYYVEDANQTFLDDLKEHNLKPLSEAKKVY